MDPELTAILGAVAATLGSSSVLAATASLVSRVLGNRARRVESDLIQTLGLAERVGPTQDHGPTPGRDSGLASAEQGERDLVNNIFVNFGDEKESAEALAEVVRHQSDGHTRLIVKYYAQGYQQALVTFIASLTFAIAGFGVVIWACVYLFQHPSEPEPAAISGAAGLVTQAVGYLFFRRADKARELMTKLIDKLREDRDREMRFIAGLASASAIRSASLRDAVKVATATSLLGIALPVSELETLASRASTSSERMVPVVNIDARPSGNNGQSAGANGVRSRAETDDDARDHRN